MALQIAAEQPSLYLDVKAAADRARLIEPALFLKRHADKPVILDEVPRLSNHTGQRRRLRCSALRAPPGQSPKPQCLR